MLQQPPAQPGMREDAVDTPALIVDLDAFEANLDHMAGLVAAAGVRLRPHAKTHKSPVVAHLQAARGAVGQCVQKVGEAEVLAWGGVPDILVSNEVVDPAKLARLAALARIARIGLCADDPRGVDAARRGCGGCRRCACACWSRSTPAAAAVARRRGRMRRRSPGASPRART